MVKISDRKLVEKIALKYAQALKKQFNLRGVYVYGSYVKGNHHEDSDIDIAVIAEDFTGDIVEDIFKLMRLRRDIDCRIEPHPFDFQSFNEDNPEAREVMRTGIKIM